MHCSEEHLISYLDGELSLVTRIRVQAHLRRCWNCRARLAASEREILRLTEAVDRWSLPGAHWMIEAKLSLNRRFEHMEASLPQLPPVRRYRRETWAITGAVILVLWTAVRLSIEPQVPPPDPIATLARVISAENALFRPAVRETLSVVIEEIWPRRIARSRRLETIADPPTGRFTASFRGSDGTLKQALWKSDDHSEFVYQPSSSRAVPQRSPGVHKNQSLVSVGDAGLDPDHVEAAFMHWLETRSWQPISLASDFSLWARQDGTLLSLERFREPSGEMIIRITGKRTDGENGVAVWVLEINATDYRPRFQTLRFKDRSREVEIRLFATSINEVPRAALMNAMFIPSVSLMRAPVESLYLTKVLPSGPLRESASLTSADRSKTLTGTIEALYALHQAGACLGTGVQISESPRGVLISNRTNTGIDQREVLATGATFEESLAALADIRGSARGSGQKSEIRCHTAALHLLAKTINSNGVAGLPDFSWKMLQTMFLDHTTMLNHQLEMLAPPGQTRSAHVDSTFDASVSLDERLNRMAKAINTVESQQQSSQVPEIQAELDLIEAEYMMVCTRRMRMDH